MSGAVVRVPAGDPARTGEVDATGPGVTARVRRRFRPARPLVGAPVLAGDVVLVTDTVRLYALDVRTGAPRWSSEPGGPLTAPAVDPSGGVHVAGPGSGLTCLDLSDGAVRRRVPDRDGGSGALSALTVAGSLLVCRSATDVLAVDAATGTERWRAESYCEVDPPLPAVAGDTLLTTRLAADNGNAVEGALVATALDDGAELWAYSGDEPEEEFGDPPWVVLPVHPVVDGDRVVVLETSQTFDDDTDEGFVVAVDPGTGQRRWRSPSVGAAARLMVPPALALGRLWLPLWGPATLLALDAGTGTPAGEVRLPAAPVTAPLVAGGRLHVLTADGALTVVDPVAGVVAGRVALDPARLPDEDSWTPQSAGLCLGDGVAAVQYGGELVLVGGTG